MEDTPTIYTIGHSTKTYDELVNKLHTHGIDVLVDVRSKPFSRYNPQFNKNELARRLPTDDIEYEWRGENMGGLDRNYQHEETIERYSILAKHKRYALMCSEGPHQKCHRFSKLAPKFKAHGVKVLHIQWSNDNLVEEYPNSDKQESLF